MNNPTYFKNKVAIITGASSGIGKSIAVKLASEQCNLGLIARDKEKLETVKLELKKFGVKVKIYPSDVSRSNNVNKIAKQIASDFGEINFLVNSAGQSILERKAEFNEEKFDNLIDVNLKGVYLSTMLLAYPLMKNGGAIVNISSIRGRTGTPSFSSGYAAAKGGVINLTKSFALEMADDNIRVNCVAPGATYPTELSKNWTTDVKKEIVSTIPQKRLGKPEDIANAVYFLLSDMSDYITGHTLDVNGGAWMN